MALIIIRENEPILDVKIFQKRPLNSNGLSIKDVDQNEIVSNTRPNWTCLNALIHKMYQKLPWFRQEKAKNSNYYALNMNPKWKEFEAKSKLKIGTFSMGSGHKRCLQK